MIVWDEGVQDYNQARTKACARLGASGFGDMPGNVEVEAALKAWLKLFATNDDKARLAWLRTTALDAMRFFGRFDPRLVGSVLKGTAGEYSAIQLHLFSDDVEAVAIEMLNHRIRYQAITRRQSRRQPQGIPGFALEWDGVPVEVLVFPVDGLRVSPPSPIDGKPMQRASREKVARLLQDGEARKTG